MRLDEVVEVVETTGELEVVIVDEVEVVDVVVDLVDNARIPAPSDDYDYYDDYDN